MSEKIRRRATQASKSGQRRVDPRRVKLATDAAAIAAEALRRAMRAALDIPRIGARPHGTLSPDVVAESVNDSGTPGRTRTCDPRLRRLADLGTNVEKFGDRDGVVTGIVAALSSAAAREPQALSRCVEALGLALGALMQSAGEDATGTDDDRRALPDERTGYRAPSVR